MRPALNHTRVVLAFLALVTVGCGNETVRERRRTDASTSPPMWPDAGLAPADAPSGADVPDAAFADAILADVARDVALDTARDSAAPIDLAAPMAEVAPALDVVRDVPVADVGPDVARDLAADLRGPDLAVDLPGPDRAVDLQGPLDLAVEAPARDAAADRTPDLAADLPADSGVEVAPPDVGPEASVPFGCGDGVPQVGEVCDDGNSGNNRCTPVCDWVPFKQLVAGNGFHCGLRTNGKLTCWGWGRASAPLPGGVFSSIAAGTFVCGLRPDGTVACWGNPQPPPSGQFEQIAVGDFACGVRKNRTLTCWSVPDDPDGTLKPPTGQFLAVAVGGASACAVRSNGTVICWGRKPEINQEVPAGTYSEVSVNSAVGACVSRAGKLVACWGVLHTPTEEMLSGVMVGSRLACGTNSTGGVCWGIEEDFVPAPAGLPAGTYVQAANDGDDGSTCGLTTSGTIACHDPVTSPNYPPMTALSSGTPTCWTTPDGAATCAGQESAPPATSRFTALAARESYQRCGLRTDERVECWGSQPGQTGVMPGRYRQVTVGENHWCALDPGGAVACWGAADLGQSVAPPGVFVGISAGPNHTCGVRADMTVTCWGGDASWSGHQPPLGQFVEVAAGVDTNCAVKTDGWTVCWGPGAFAAEIPPSGLRHLSVGTTVACGLTAARSVQCWGDSLPWVPLGAFLSVTAYEDKACALRVNGQLVCFGLRTINIDNWP